MLQRSTHIIIIYNQIGQYYYSFFNWRSAGTIIIYNYSNADCSAEQGWISKNISNTSQHKIANFVLEYKYIISSTCILQTKRLI